jgi:hypothetical protein
MGGILIPKVKTTRPKTKGKSTPTNKKKQTQRIATLEELGIPLDLNLFNQSILYSQGDKFSTVAWTTLDNVRREFFQYSQLPKGTWTEKSVREEAKKHNNISSFRKLVGACNRATELGIYDEITAHMDRRDKKSKWTFELVKNEAKKYSNRTDFRKNSRSAYGWAEENDLMNDVCEHMGKSTTLQWTKETISKEAKKYKYRTEFRSGNPSAYTKAIQMRILQKVCSHMKPKERVKKK